MKWSDEFVYVENKSKKLSKYLERLNNIKRKVINDDEHFRRVYGQPDSEDRFDR